MICFFTFGGFLKLSHLPFSSLATRISDLKRDFHFVFCFTFFVFHQVGIHMVERTIKVLHEIFSRFEFVLTVFTLKRCQKSRVVARKSSSGHLGAFFQYVFFLKCTLILYCFLQLSH